jgi:hypothetical protein
MKIATSSTTGTGSAVIAATAVAGVAEGMNHR